MLITPGRRLIVVTLACRGTARASVLQTDATRIGLRRTQPMSDRTRRDVLQAGAGLGLAALVGVSGAADEPDKKKMLTDRDHVIAAGMTPEEADCWQATADAAGK